MRFLDPFNSASEMAVVRAANSAREQIRMLELGSGYRLSDYFYEQDAIRRVVLPPFGLGERLVDASIRASTASDWIERHQDMFEPARLARAHEAAYLAQGMELTAAMDAYRTPLKALAEKALRLPNMEWLENSTRLAAFNETSAIGDLIGQSVYVDLDLFAGIKASSIASMPHFDSIMQYGQFLNAAGLGLPHWPRRRLLSAAQRQRLIRQRLKRNTEPGHVRQAKSLVHRYERTLREIVGGAMAQTYGEEWPEERLPLCNCKGLLGRWRNGGGFVLDHADYAHYVWMMVHPEHFDDVFQVAFADPEVLANLLKAAGDLRAASHHGRPFTQEDLRSLRLTWRTLEVGLAVLVDEYDL